MQPVQSKVETCTTRYFFAFLFIFLIAFSPVSAQVAANSSQGAVPAKVESRLIMLSDRVVREQWSHSTKMVNAPHNITLLNPGQCVRFAVYATGDKRDEYLDNTHIRFTVEFADQKQAHSDVSFSEIKEIKPSAPDFAVTALAGKKQLPQSRFSMGASRLNWCVPSDAADGTATISASVETPDGHLDLQATPIHVQSFQTGSKAQFRTNKEFDDFLPSYYRQPNPARLLPVLQFLVAAQTAHPNPAFEANVSAFLSAALKADPLASEDFQMRVDSQPPAVRAVGFNILRSAGHFIDAQVNAWSAADQAKFQALAPLADPYDLSATKVLAGHLDMLWSSFWATGQLEPVQAIVSELGWMQEFNTYDRLRKSGAQQSAPPQLAAHALSYEAAGRSLVAFQRNNPLVADYIDYLFASDDTSAEIKSALGSLATNPAFKPSQPQTQAKPQTSAPATAEPPAPSAPVQPAAK